MSVSSYGTRFWFGWDGVGWLSSWFWFGDFGFDVVLVWSLLAPSSLLFSRLVLVLVFLILVGLSSLVFGCGFLFSLRFD